MKKFFKIKFVPNTHFAIQIFFSANLGTKNFGLKLEKSVKFFFLKIGRKKKSIMQSGYGEQTLLNNYFFIYY